MKISAILAQFPITLSIPRNIEFIERVTAQAAAGDWVILPEGSVSGYSTETSFLEHINHLELTAGLKRLQKEAERRKIHLWVGACIQIEGKWFNTAYGFSPDGETCTYHKINLANHERGIFTPGDHLPVFVVRTPDGNVIVGVQMCRELRFPEQWGWLARCGAQIFLHLNNAIDDATLQPVWKSHLVSRAAETQRFVLSANNAASKQICPTMAVAPNGQVIGEIVSPDIKVLRVECDLSKVSNGYLNQSRSDVVF
jgi:predicted amidohydrolase